MRCACTQALFDATSVLELLLRNKNFRRVWLGSVVSLFGDWFNTIALFTLIGGLTGSPMAVGAVLATKMIAFATCSPIAGIIADRFDRRRLMILSDLLRAAIVLLFLFVRDAEHVPLAYALIFLQIAVGSVFRPAKSASVPNIVRPDELLTANTIMSATWSTLLALGAALGGLATAALGTDAIFLVDAASYLVSALLLYGTSFETPPPKPSERGVIATAITDLRAGWRYLSKVPAVGRMALAKATWAVGGAGLVYLLTQLGEEMRPDAPSVGIGWLFAARGLGTGVGPVLARAALPNRAHWPLALGLFVVCSALCYAVAAVVGSFAWLVFFVIVAHAMSGANWVLSTVLLQERAENAMQGRVFATEWVILTGVDAVMILAVSGALEAGWLDVRGAMFACAAIMALGGAIWTARVPKAERAMRRARAEAGDRPPGP